MSRSNIVDRYRIAAIGIQVIGFIFGVFLAGSRIPASQLPSSQTATAPNDISFTVIDIFLHNATVVLTQTAGGVLLGVPTIVALIYSGIPLGMLLTNGAHPALIVPHAMFEFPAIWIASAAGLRVPHEVIQYLRGVQDSIITDKLVQYIVRSTVLAVGLLVIASFVERYVTVWIVRTFVLSA